MKRVALNKYEQTVLAGWEDVHNKGQLSLWILLALKDGAKHMSQIKQFVVHTTERLIDPDDKSMYRALRRFNDAELVTYKMVPGNAGPDLKQYRITKTGHHVLGEFLQRNITGILYKDSVQALIRKEAA